MSPIRSNKIHVKEVVKKERLLHWKKMTITSFISLVFVAAALSGVWSLNQSLSIKHWNIYAASPLKEDIAHALKGMDTLDFWHSRPAMLRTQLLNKLPDLADIQIQRQLPDTLLIHVSPRQAIALWMNKNGLNKANADKKGQLYLVDENGIAYRSRKRGESSDLPVLRIQQDQLVAACQWLATLKKEQPQWFARSSELFASHNGWKLNLVAGPQWHIPLWSRGLKNISQLSSILQQPRWHAGNWRIDTRLENRWFFRPATHEGVI